MSKTYFRPGQCCYIEEALGGGVSLFCCAKTKMRYVLDDDGNRVRKYEPFCEKHAELFDEVTDD